MQAGCDFIALEEAMAIGVYVVPGIAFVCGCVGAGLCEYELASLWVVFGGSIVGLLSSLVWPPVATIPVTARKGNDTRGDVVYRGRSNVSGVFKFFVRNSVVSDLLLYAALFLSAGSIAVEDLEADVGVWPGAVSGSLCAVGSLYELCIRRFYRRYSV